MWWLTDPSSTPALWGLWRSPQLWSGRSEQGLAGWSADAAQPQIEGAPHARPPRNSGGGVPRDRDADARHRGRQHRPVAHRPRPSLGPERPRVGGRCLHPDVGDRGIELRLARRSPRSQARVRGRHGAVHRRLAVLRAGRLDRRARRRPRGPGHRRGGDVRHLSGDLVDRLPRAGGAGPSVRGLRRHDRRVVRDRPTGRWSADQRSRLAIGVLRQHPAWARRPVGDSRVRFGVLRSVREPPGLARTAHLGWWAVPARAGTIAWRLRGLGQHTDRR